MPGEGLDEIIAKAKTLADVTGVIKQLRAMQSRGPAAAVRPSKSATRLTPSRRQGWNASGDDISPKLIGERLDASKAAHPQDYDKEWSAS